MKENIVLIGMPGVGKSTVGVILAKLMGYQFIDADLVIQDRENKLLKEIIAEKGIDGFNFNLVYLVLLNKSLNTKNGIISTGGSVVYGREAMEHLSEIATVVYLELDLANLKKRLGNLKNRGVVLRDGQTLDDLFNERVPLYEKYADVVVNESNINVEETVQLTLEKIKEYKGEK